MMKRDDGDDDFVTKTAKHRKKHGVNGQQQQSTPSEHEHLASSGTKADSKPPAPAASGGADGISLRPRTMFAMKGRGRTESEGSAYRPQWSKDGEGFVTAASSSSAATAAAPNTGGKDAAAAYHDPQGAADAARRKGKVLRYSKEELLALHFTTTSPPEFPPETMVASELALPPVSTLPFDYEEIYEQWKLNRNRGGRGRGRGTSTGNNGQNDSGQQQSSSSDRSRSNGKWDDEKPARRDTESQGDDSTWQRGIKPSASSSRHRDDIWDNVGDGSSESNEMDLSSMAMAAEKFRREMDALRSELNAPLAVDLKENDGNLDEFDKKLEVAAAAGQFEDSDEEDVQWDDPSDLGDLGGGNGSLGDQHHHSSLFFEQSSSSAGASSGANESHHFGLLDSKQFGLGGGDSSGSYALQQQQQQQSLSGVLEPLRMDIAPAPVIRDEWFYLDPQGIQQGPFKSVEMREWFEAGYFKPHLPIRFGHDGQFTPLANQFLHGQVPFAAPLPTPESFHSAMQPQFQSDFRTQHHLGSHDPALRDALFLNESHHARQQNEFWGQSAVHAPVLSSTDALFGQQQQQQQQEQVQQQSNSPPPAKTDTRAADPWGKPLTEADNSNSSSAAFSLHQIQDEEKRKAAEEVRSALSNSSSSVSSDKPVAAAAVTSPARPAKQQQPAAASKQSPAASTKTSQKTSTTPAKTETTAKKPAATAAAQFAKTKTKSNDAGKGAWVDPSAAPAKSLHEIQQEEQRELRKKMEESASGANLEQMGAQLKMMLGVQPMASAAAPAAPTQQAPPAPSSSSGPSPWGVPAAAAQPTQASKQSLRDILAEEERLAQERAKQNQSSSSASSHWVNVVAGTTATPAPKPTRSLGPVPVSVLKSRQQIRSTTATATNGADVKSAAPTPPKPDNDASFWNFGAAQAATKAAPSSGNSSAPGELQVSNAFGSSAGVSSEFMTWAAKQFQQISGRNDLTLMEYCMSLEDPGEIREYLAAYLGSTPRVSAFATEFIQRKKKGPAPAALKRSPSNGGKNDGDDATAGKKTSGSGKRRGGKGQKIDPSLLNFA